VGEALFAEARTKNSPGLSLPLKTRCLYETRFGTFIPERSCACLGLFPAARHRDRAGQLATELRQQHAIELGSEHSGHPVRSELGAGAFFGRITANLEPDAFLFGLDGAAVKPKFF
jgi:hypothetical protein